MANLSERLAALVPTWGAKMAYGERTTLGGHDLVPVALVVFGFGGGEGSGEMPQGGSTPAAILIAGIPLVSAIGWAVALIAGAGSGRRGANRLHRPGTSRLGRRI